MPDLLLFQTYSLSLWPNDFTFVSSVFKAVLKEVWMFTDFGSANNSDHGDEVPVH